MYILSSAGYSQLHRLVYITISRELPTDLFTGGRAHGYIFIFTQQFLFSLCLAFFLAISVGENTSNFHHCWEL